MFEIFRKIYLNSIFYDKKISKTSLKNLEYKPSNYLLFSIVRIKTKKFNIKDFSLETVWTNKKLNQKQINKLNNFFWLFSLDLKSSAKEVQLIIQNWIELNSKYNLISWGFDTTAKRLISWLSNCKLTYDGCDEDYKFIFNNIIQKQTFHLLNQIKQTDKYDDKLIGTAAIILVGLSYKEEKKFLLRGLDFLKRITKTSLDENGFPKSRSIKQSIFYLKYFILIREWFNESQTEVPEFINETIFYLGQSYAFFYKNYNFEVLFNGNNVSTHQEFDHYLKRLGYNFKYNDHEFSNYLNMRSKKTNLVMDIGPSPTKKFSQEYQAGALSFEFLSNGNKIFTNSGYFNTHNSKLNELSRSSAVHNVLIVDDNSSCKFKKKFNNKLELLSGLRIIKKEISYNKDYWKVIVAHDGYLKKYNLIYEREIEFDPKNTKLSGIEKIIGKKEIPNLKFDIRFHLEPNSKLMKTQNNKSIFIDANGEGWKFVCNDNKIDIDNGLYFGKKNSYAENQNIFISGITNSKESFIRWELIKI